MNSIYAGTLYHKRIIPKINEFKYPVGMFFVDVEQIEKLFNWFPFFTSRGFGLFGFYRKNYLKNETDPERSIRDCVHDAIAKTTSVACDYKIMLLTQISHFGFCFNPVSFYYCYSKSTNRLEYIVSEITNTPWNERHCNVLKCESQGSYEFEFNKDFHVSPFINMNVRYVWQFNSPGESLSVKMYDYDSKSGEQIFQAALNLQRRPFNKSELTFYALKFPFMTLKTFFQIYFQAARLWLKGVPFVPHPVPRAPHPKGEV